MSEDAETTAREIFALMLDLSREIRCCGRDESFCGQLTFQQFVILDAVARAGELGLAELHGILAVEKSTTTRLVDPLLRKGLLNKDRSAHDQRAARLSLTAEGRRTHREVWACLTVFFAGLARNIGEAERETVLGALRRFADALGKTMAECRCDVQAIGAGQGRAKTGQGEGGCGKTEAGDSGDAAGKGRDKEGKG